MSIHPTLKSSKNKVRSVLKRHERLARALEDGKRKEGDSVFSLPKYNPPKVKKVKSVKTEETTLDNTDVLEQHKLIKESMSKKKKKSKKETTGRK